MTHGLRIGSLLPSLVVVSTALAALGCEGRYVGTVDDAFDATGLAHLRLANGTGDLEVRR